MQLREGCFALLCQRPNLCEDCSTDGAKRRFTLYALLAVAGLERSKAASNGRQSLSTRIEVGNQSGPLGLVRCAHLLACGCPVGLR
ncbi:hypothetical protein NON20_23880 (plasmid) [Synechocystis sp. B12]|nr:hypothetical protein NON20_23880 [Synechocystis sp. B12]